MKHVSESDLALYSSGDLSLWPRLKAAVHLRRCEECRNLAGAYEALREDTLEGAEILPAGLAWDRLAAEMRANIHVALAAGECVAPAGHKESRSPWNWRPAAAVAGLSALFVAAWWLNVPASDKESLNRVLHGLPAKAFDDRGPVVAATASGIEFRENGSSLKLRLHDAQPVEVSLSAGGSASAHYVDDDTGQVTITTVYVQ